MDERPKRTRSDTPLAETERDETDVAGEGSAPGPNLVIWIGSALLVLTPFLLLGFLFVIDRLLP